MPHSKEIHAKIIEVARNRASSPSPLIAVFDLDSTLFNVTQRTQRILHDFAGDPEMQRLYPNECAQLKISETEHTDWGIRQTLVRSGIRSELLFFEAVREFWAKHFFSNPYLDWDIPYTGAVDFTRSIFEAGARIMYLTGRDRPRMETGTITGLKKWNFPLVNPVSDLIMKPDRHLRDESFKASELERFCAEDSDVWFFENEPVIINHVRRQCPNVNLVFIDSVHSGREASPADLPVIQMHYTLSD